MGLFGFRKKANEEPEDELISRPVLSPVAGTLLRYKVSDGAHVKRGDTVIILESMMLELEVKTPVSGIINFFVEPNKRVNAGEKLAIVRSEKQIEADAKAKAEAEAKAAAEAKLKAEEEAKAKAEAEAKAKAEAETKAKAEAEEKAKNLAETQAVLSQMESDLEAKKAELASLGMDAQGIVRKASLNKEIKELEPQIEILKAEVERLSK